MNTTTYRHNRLSQILVWICSLWMLFSISLHADPTPLDQPLEYTFPTNPSLSELKVKTWKPDEIEGLVVVVAGYKNRIPRASDKPDRQDLEQKLEDADDVSNWVNFCLQNKLGCMWVSMASDLATLQKGGGYYAAESGSGRLLQSSITKYFADDIPIYFVGYNTSGSRFVASFLAFKPDKIKNWCCLGGAETWPDISKLDGLPMGIIAMATTGENYNEAYSFYQAGLKAGKVWTWVNFRPEDKTKLWNFIQLCFTSLADPGTMECHSLQTKEVVNQLSSNGNNPPITWLSDYKAALAWNEIHQPKDDRPTVIEKVIDPSKPGLPPLAVYLRLPPHALDASSVDGVIGYCTWVGDRQQLIGALSATHDEATTYPTAHNILEFANTHNLAVLTWSTPGKWNNNMSEEDLAKDARKLDDDEFDTYAASWDEAIQFFCLKYKLPENNYLLFGMSRGAQWAHRLVMRRPDRFLAVSIHISSTYDVPTEAAKRCIWLVTTGELEYGYESAKRFYGECRNLGYPIIFKAGVGLGHADSEEMNTLRYLFFEYALDIKKQRFADAAPNLEQTYEDRNNPPPLPPFPESLANPPYVGDLVNQEMYPIDQIDMVPTGFRVPLPTKEIAETWNKNRAFVNK